VRFALRQRRYFAGALTARPLIAFGRLAAVCRRCADERRYYCIHIYIYIHTRTYRIGRGDVSGAGNERESEWKRKKLLRHVGETGVGMCARRSARNKEERSHN